MKAIVGSVLLSVAAGVLPLAILADDAPINSISPTEKAAGWRLLFDGKSLTGWRPYSKPGSAAAPIGAGWHVQDGILKKLAGQTGGDIVTEQTFDNFELAWDWRLAKGANNGVKYFVTELRPSAPGHEYQMIDDAAFPKMRDKDLTASFYDVLAPAADKPLKPPGEWNASRIIVQGNRVEHWLNDRKVLEYELGSDAVKAALAASKFKKHPDFGNKISGHIMLTDHHDEAWFRNIKLRELPTR
jgi:hypothetical protein